MASKRKKTRAAKASRRKAKRRTKPNKKPNKPAERLPVSSMHLLPQLRFMD